MNQSNEPLMKLNMGVITEEDFKKKKEILSR